MIKRFRAPGGRTRASAFTWLLTGCTIWTLLSLAPMPPVLAQTLAELRVVDETAPPGGTALFLVQMTEPEPISSGQTKIRYGAKTPLVAARKLSLGTDSQVKAANSYIAQQSLFGPVSRVDVLSISDEVSGNVSIADGAVSVQIAAKAGLFGTDRDLPLVAFAVPVSPTAIPGQTFTVEIELASLAGPGGASYQVTTKPGTFTVGGSAISDISPYRGFLWAGSVLTVNGVGFEPGADVKIDETKVDSVEFVSSTQLRVHLGSSLELRNTTGLRLRNPSGSSDLYYPINSLPTAIPSPGTMSFLSASRPFLANVVDAIEIQSDLVAAGDLNLQVSDPSILSVEGGLSLPAGPHLQNVRVMGRKAGLVTLTAKANGLESTLTVDVREGSVFQVPVLRNTPDLRMGLALTNRASHPVDVRLRGFSKTGLATQPIEYLLQMQPGRQIARFLDEITPLFVNFSGWVEVSSPDPGLSVMFIHLPAGYVRYPGAAAETRGRRQFVLTLPDSTGRYELVLANNNLAAAQVAFTWVTSNGQTLASRSRTIESQGALLEDIRSLLGDPVPPLGDGYLEVRSSEDLTGFFEMTDLPLLFGADLGDPAETGRALELPRVAAGAGWETYVDIANLSDSSSTGSLRTRLQTGEVLPAKDIVLPAHGFVRIKLSQLEGADASRLWGGSAQIRMNGKTAASALLTGPSGSGLAASLPVYQSSAAEYVFSQVANGSLAGFQLFTGLAIANSGAEISQVKVEVRDADGILRGERAVSLAPGASRVELLSELIPGLPAQFGGHILISSTQPILAVEMFGDYSLSFLSAVPFRIAPAVAP